MAERADARLQAMSTLLLIEQEARKAETLSELSFVIANDTRRLLPCDQVFFWLSDEFSVPRVHRAANVSEVDSNSPKIRWIEGLLKWCIAQPWHTDLHILQQDQLTEALAADWHQFFADQVLYVPISGKGFSGGLLLVAKTPWLEGHQALAGVMAGAYAHAWQALRKPDRRRAFVAHLRQFRWRYIIAVAVLLLYPARQYVLAPAEVVARQPLLITAPITGVIEKIHVQPNQQVTAETLLFQFEDIELENRLVLSQRALDVAEAEFLKNAQASFNCEECRARAAELRAMLERERAMVAMATQQLQRTRVLANAGGVVVFSDINDWEGRPVRVGERVMLVADPADTALSIELPVDDAIAIDIGSEVVFYPNVNPLSSYTAVIHQTSYEARVAADQALAYPLLASFDDGNARLGLRGTAKIYGGRAPVIYLLLRKPLSWLRRSLGW